MIYLANRISMEEIFMMFAVLFGLMAISFIALFIVRRKRDVEDKSHPIQRGRAKLVDKQQLAPGTILAISEMWVLFELENGRRLQLVAKAQNSLVIGDEGMLTWQGKRILKFERDQRR